VSDVEPADFTLMTMPERFAALGDRHAGIDDRPCSLESLLELSARQEKEGQGDAPWPPHYRKQPGEPPRVQPSKRRAPAKAAAKKAAANERAPSKTPRKKASPGRRVSKHPLVEIGRAKRKADALAGLERWKTRHPEAAAHLEPADVLVDAMRGRYSTWTRIRVNLQHVPAKLRPRQEPLDPDDEPSWAG
jgi:hypothetical protein